MAGKDAEDVTEEVGEETLEEEGFPLRTKLTWEQIILEELRVINRLIIDAGKSFSRQNIFMLKEAVDSWEQDLAPLADLPDNRGTLNESNEEITASIETLLKDWTVEKYNDCVMRMIKKKGIIIKILAQAGKYMPITTVLQEEEREIALLEEERKNIIEDSLESNS